MVVTQFDNYIVTHRKKAGLSQNELARLLECVEGSVSRHESAKALPPLPTAMKYAAIFRVPIDELFPGLQFTVEQAVEDSLSRLEREFQEISARSPRKAQRYAKRLAWFSLRRTLSEA